MSSLPLLFGQHLSLHYYFDLKRVLLIPMLLLSFGLFNEVWSQSCDLFFSEYIEGSSSNKAFEIFNPSEDVADLNSYVIYRFNNGSQTATDSLFPQGMLSSGEVYVIANHSATAPILGQSDTTHTITFYNGDDVLALINKSTTDTLDIIGEIGVDPGSGWPVGTGATNNFTLVRNEGVLQGNTNWAIAATEWDVFPIDFIDSLGSHSSIMCMSDCAFFGELFFSEYLEGSSSNKAIEIFNPSEDVADLSNYVIYRFNNGSQTATDSLFPQGMLAPGEVYVVANPSATAPILGQSDTTHTMTFYNGDDALLLINRSTADTLDIIGEIGIDPGSGWPVGPGATNNSTLVRKTSIVQGNTNWAVAAAEWDVFPIDFLDSLGDHNIIIDCTLNIWNGSESINWFNINNWSQHHIPLFTEKVLIPSGHTVDIPNNKFAQISELEVSSNSIFTVRGEISIVVIE